MIYPIYCFISFLAAFLAKKSESCNYPWFLPQKKEENSRVSLKIIQITLGSQLGNLLFSMPQYRQRGTLHFQIPWQCASLPDRQPSLH